ncbi:uncharacterized protein LOC107038811 [Diachasma alloeum]|uniref:uncharacterized protein LOC107038811 n=1 Tax=Diachasma alloeum TaxID=454923 RepID=UPI0007380FBF|nr:uncharacterized protein LOC107038811 [Diachasma alloeum]
MKGACGIIVLGCVAVAFGYPAGEAPAAAQPAPLSDLIEQAKAGITNLGQEISKRLEKDGQTTLESLKTQSTNFANNLQELLNKVSEDVKAKSPEIQKAWDGVKNKFTDVVNDINAQIPQAQQQASQLGTKLTHGLNVLVEESSKAAKEISKNSEQVQEDLAKFTKQAVEIAVKTTNNLDAQLRQLAVTETPKA